jgi:Fic family protein
MKIPVTPPELGSLAQAILDSGGVERLAKLFGNPQGPAPGGRYLHWDELRHRPPPADLTTDEWWFVVKTVRGALAKPLPLRDIAGRPFSLVLADPVLELTHRIDRDAAGPVRLDGPVANAETRDTYLVRSLIEEAMTSSQLEGATTTRQVAKEMLRQGRKPRDRAEQMIYNNFLAMRSIRDWVQQPLTPEAILGLHRTLTLDTLDDASAAGRLRRPDEAIDVVDNASYQILHTPPPAGELPERLDRLCRFANPTDADPFIPPVLRAILLHFALAYDHPFVDGNGRVARALFYWSALSQGYWLIEFISISSVLRRAPARYAPAYLFTETDGGDVTYFLVHQLETILAALDGLYGYLKRKASELQATEAMLRGSDALRGSLNHRQLALLRHALRHPGAVYTIEGHRRSHNVVYQTGRADLLALAKLGLLERRKLGRAFTFEAPANLQERLGRIDGVLTQFNTPTRIPLPPNQK